MKLGAPWTQNTVQRSQHETETESVHARLDDLSQQLDRLSKVASGKFRQEGSRSRETAREAGPSATGANRPAQFTEPQQPPELSSSSLSVANRGGDNQAGRWAGNRPLNRRLLKTTYGGPALDRAVADIAARQRAIESEDRGATPAQQSADPGRSRPQDSFRSTPQDAQRPAPPTQNLSGLEAQLRNITERIESLRRPEGVEDMIATLRHELSDIGRSLAEAMPRQAIESIETEIRSLAERLDQSRQCGVDASALANLDRGLAEVGDALRSLTPAESLTGFQAAIQGLSHKIDSIAASHYDPAILEQLEAAITGLRSIVAHVASDDALGRLTDEVRGLAAKIEHIAGSAAPYDILNTLDRRIAAIAQAIAENNTRSRPASTDMLEQIERRIAAMAEAMQESNARGRAAPTDVLNNLDRRIAAMAQAIEESNARGGHVPSQIENVIRSLTDKIERLQLSRGETVAFDQLEERIARLVEKVDASDMRLNHLEAIERGLADVLVYLEEQRRKGTMRTDNEPIDWLKRDMEAVNAALNRVSDRLSTIESEIHAGRNTRAAAAPPTAPQMPPAAQLAAQQAPNASQQPRPKAAPAHEPPRSRGAAELPPSAPKAPSSSDRPATATSPSPRAAREHQPIDPNLPPDHPLEPGSTGRPRAPSAADRIAASEAALGRAKPPVIPDPAGKSDFIAAARRAAQAATRQLDANGLPAGDSEADKQSFGQRISGKVRSLLVGASVVVLTLGALRLTMTLIEPLNPGTTAPTVTEAPAIPSAPKSAQTTADPASSILAARLPDPPESHAPPATVATPEPPPPTVPAPAAKSEPTAKMTAKAPDEVTGSIPPSGAANPPLPPSRPAEARTRPDDSPGLAAAAEAGNPAAAYLVAERQIEGKDGKQNYEEAARLLERASRQGLAPAQFRLGTLYEKGLGVKKDLNAARKLYAAAAEKGNAKAMHNLAVLYAEGIDGKPDYQLAGQWFRKAAERGVADSQYNLGVLCARGIGVAQNIAESYKWFALAAQQGDKDAGSKRDEIAGKLDAEQLMAAKLAVKTWTAVPQPAEATTVQVPPEALGRAAPTPPKAPSAKRRTRTHAPLQLGRL